MVQHHEEAFRAHLVIILINLDRILFQIIHRHLLEDQIQIQADHTVNPLLGEELLHRNHILHREQIRHRKLILHRLRAAIQVQGLILLLPEVAAVHQNRRVAAEPVQAAARVREAKAGNNIK